MVRQIYVFIFAVLVVILGACGIVSYLSRKPIGKYVGFLCLALIPPVLGNMIIVSSTTEGRALVGCYIYYIGMDLIMAALIDRVKDELSMIQKRIKLQGMKGNFTVRENMHLTLAFIGEYSDPEQVSDVLNDVVYAPMKIALDGFGCFKDLYWISIKEDKGLIENVKRIRKALSDNDIPFDRKKFVPHIMLARKIEYEKDLPTDCSFPASMDVEYISLMRSDRGKSGMIYTPIAEYVI